MDDRKKRLQKSLLDAFGGGEPEAPAMPMPQSQPIRQPSIDPEIASRAQRSMRKAFGGEQAEQLQPSQEELDKLSSDLDRILKIKQQSPEEQDQRDELLRQLQVEYLRKKSLGQ